MSSTDQVQRARLSYVVLAATVFAILVIGLGAYTRLVHAGLGCPDWPLCYGHLWAPEQSSDIDTANLNFPDSPVNLEKTWPEMTHRYLATSLGLFCIVILLWCLRLKRRDPAIPIKHPAALLGFIILQGFFGMWTVTLKLWPQVVTLHLAGGFTTFCLLLLLYLRLRNKENSVAMPNASKLLAGLALVICTGQVLLGGWLTSNYAAMACPQLPLCDISAITAADVTQGFNVLQQIGPNYLGGQLDGGARVAIHAMHRFGAIAVMICLLMLLVNLAKLNYHAITMVIATLLTAQVLLGVANVYFNLPLFNAVAHNITGALLLGSLVWANYQMRAD